MHYFIYEILLHKKKTKKQTDVKKNQITTTTNQKPHQLLPLPSLVLISLRSHKVQLVASDHSFRVEGDQVGGNSICREQLTTPN